MTRASDLAAVRRPQLPKPVRPRPRVFRALGHEDPPATIECRGEQFVRTQILKHDSWAATAIYESRSCQAICKFNRRQRILVVPMAWLGRLLASRERRFMHRLAGIAGIPVSVGRITAHGQFLKNAVGHVYVEGHALAEREHVDDDFFPRLAAILAAVHARDVAHVDLHKRENILVDETGHPCLIDFQISFGLPRRSRLAAAVLRPVLRMLQQCDDYHLLKHRVKHRPDQIGLTPEEFARRRPWWIRLHRCIAIPFRGCRRRLLTLLNIRSRSGHAHSEAFPEIAHRPVAAA